MDSAIFLVDEYDITPALSVYAGVRYSMFGSYGPHTVYTYMQDASINSNTKIDSIRVWDTMYCTGSQCIAFQSILTSRLLVPRVLPHTYHAIPKEGYRGRESITFITAQPEKK